MDNIFGRDRHKVDVTAGAGLTISAHIKDTGNVPSQEDLPA